MNNLKIKIHFIFILLLTIDSYIYPLINNTECQRIRDSLNIFYSRDYTFHKVPKIKGGLDSLLQKLNYPKEALENKIEGKVYVNVIIDTTGTPMCPEIVGKKLGYGCDVEAVKLVMIAKFTPAIMLRKKGTVKMTVPVSVPITFTLKDQ